MAIVSFESEILGLYFSPFILVDGTVFAIAKRVENISDLSDKDKFKIKIFSYSFSIDVYEIVK
mgnify:CR=1 FL=1